MPRLLTAVLCVMEAFHKYAREDGDQATLTCRELKRLLRGETGDFLQSHVIHAVERHLNLLDTNNDGTINFDEFVLAIFSLLDLCYLDMKSLVNSEPREVSQSEKATSNDMDLQAITRNGHQVGGTLPTQEKVLFPSGIASSSKLSWDGESQATGHKKVHSQEGSKTHNLPRGARKPRGPKSQHLQGDEQSQEVAQDAPAMEDDRAQIKTNKPSAGSEQTSSPTKQVPREGAKPVRRESGNETSDQFEEQEENLKLKQDPTQGLPDQEAVPGKSIENLSEAQEPHLQGDNEPRSEHLLEPAAAGKPSQTQKSANPEDGQRTLETPEPGKDVDRTSTETTGSDEPEDYGRTSETQESPAQEREHEIKDPQVSGGSEDVSETPGIRAERKESRGLQACGPAPQKEYEKKTQPPVPETHTQHGTYQELQRSSKEGDSDTPDLSTEKRNQNRPETEGTSFPGEEMRHPEEDTAPAFVDSKNGPAAKGTPRARERAQDSTSLERQSEGDYSRTTKPCDKPIGEEGGSQGEDPEAPDAQNCKGSRTTPSSLSPGEGDSNSETGELHMQGNSKSQAHPHRRSVQESHHHNPDLQKCGAPGENRAQKAVVLLVREEKTHLREEQEEPAGVDLKSHSTGTKSPDAAAEPSRTPEVQKSTRKGKSRKSLEAGGLDTNCTVTQLCEKGDSRKELKTQGPVTKEEEDRAPESQEIPFKSPGEDNPAFHKTHLDAEEPATLEEENESPCKPAGKSDKQQSQTKKRYDPSVPLPGPEERMQRNQKPCSVQRDVIQSSALHQSLQKKIQQARHGGSSL
ncbi:trichohyalin-like protein 1 [Fukomys damarensis]|uniref:trichohyalin-like protein 1 n=1 Tax=Fukomys damarensis TaxID=885580 RepID=UPI00054005EE|nr:trichohyalin-like protein 1 [Fukomys damarensis]